MNGCGLQESSGHGLNHAHQFKQGHRGMKNGPCFFTKQSLNQCKKSTHCLWLGDRLVTICDYCVALMQRMGRRHLITDYIQPLDYQTPTTNPYLPPGIKQASHDADGVHP